MRRSVSQALRAGAHFALFGSAIGVVLALAPAWQAVGEHGYLAQGFVRNALLELRRELPAGALAGAAVGLALAALRALRGPLLAARRRGSLAPYLAASALVALCLVAKTHVDGLRPPRGELLGALGVLWCGAVLAWRPGDPESPVARASADALLFGGALAAAVLVGASRETEAWLAQPSGLVAAALAVALLAAADWLAEGPRPAALALPLRGLAVAAVAGGLLLAGAPPDALPSGLASSHPRSAVLIGVDTLRRDRTTLLGPGPDGRDLTPALRRFAAGGTVFERAISQAPWTMPSFSSMLTGRYPAQHGATSLYGGLRARETTLAELAREAGYRTAAVVSHFYVDSRHGLAQGFDVFDETNVRGHWDITGSDVTDRAIELLDGFGDEPFLLWVHYFDPHYEYRDHEEWPWADAYRGWLRSQPMEVNNLLKNRQLLGPADVRYLRDLYDEEVAYTDRQIGRLLDEVRRRAPDAAVVVVADHGEEFMERGFIGHTTNLHTEVVQVPLVARLPDLEAPPARFPHTVETRRVFTTLLESLGIPPPAGAPPSLQQALRSGRGDATAFTQVHLPDAPLETGKRVFISSARSDCCALIEDHFRGRQEFFEDASDPDERVERSASGGPDLEALRASLGAWLRGEGHPGTDVPTQAISPELRRQLEALGYLN